MIEGVHFVRSVRSGKPVRWYVYAWRGGPCILKAEGAAKPKLGREQLKAIAEAIEDAKAVRPDTLAGMIRAWRGNPADVSTASIEWQGLAPTTRDTWGLALNLIEQKWGETPLTLWNDSRMVGVVMDWRDSRAATPRAADIGVTVLSQLLEWGRLRARVRVNVAAGIPQLYKGANRSEIIWTEADIERFMVAALQLNRPNIIDGLWLALFTGLRRSDLVALTWGEVGDLAIVRIAQKKSRGRRRRAVVPLIPETDAFLEELRTRNRLPGVENVLVNSHGRPWTKMSFTAAFNEVRNHAGIVEPANPQLGTPERTKHLHDVRGTLVTRLCRAGLSDREIADIVAWSPTNVANIRRVYVDDAAVVVALSERIRRAV